jgi:hypothetical protein
MGRVFTEAWKFARLATRLAGSRQRPSVPSSILCVAAEINSFSLEAAQIKLEYIKFTMDADPTAALQNLCNMPNKGDVAFSEAIALAILSVIDKHGDKLTPPNIIEALARTSLISCPDFTSNKHDIHIRVNGMLAHYAGAYAVQEGPTRALKAIAIPLVEAHRYKDGKEERRKLLGLWEDLLPQVITNDPKAAEFVLNQAIAGASEANVAWSMALDSGVFRRELICHWPKPFEQMFHLDFNHAASRALRVAADETGAGEGYKNAGVDVWRKIVWRKLNSGDVSAAHSAALAAQTRVIENQDYDKAQVQNGNFRARCGTDLLRAAQGILGQIEELQSGARTGAAGANLIRQAGSSAGTTGCSGPY